MGFPSILIDIIPSLSFFTRFRMTWQSLFPSFRFFLWVFLLVVYRIDKFTCMLWTLSLPPHSHFLRSDPLQTLPQDIRMPKVST